MAFNWDHACLDKDGTVTDVHRYWRHTCSLRVRRVAESLRLPPQASDGLLGAMGVSPVTGRIIQGGPVGYKPRLAVIEAVIRHLREQAVSVTAEQIGEIFNEIDREQQRTDDYRIVVLPGVTEFLRHLVAHRVAVSIFTSDRRSNTTRVLELLELDRYVPVVVGGESVRQPKPHPEGFLLACSLVNSVPGRTVYVSDTIQDLQMARAGGAGAALGVATGLDSLEDLRPHADIVCNRLDELVSP